MKDPKTTQKQDPDPDPKKSYRIPNTDNSRSRWGRNDTTFVSLLIHDIQDKNILTNIITFIFKWQKILKFPVFCVKRFHWQAPPHTAKTKCRKFETNIPRKGILGPQSLFPHSCVYERIIYSQVGSACSAGGNMQTDPGNI